MVKLESTLRKYFHKDLVYPAYEDFCISNIPSVILSLFGVPRQHAFSHLLSEARIESDKPQHVLLFLLDGFGFDQFQKYADEFTFFHRLAQHGVVTPITSVFPSTTAASVTASVTGLTPQQHGLPEWWVYFQEFDRVITTLPFTPIESRERDKMLKLGADPQILFNSINIHDQLKTDDIPSFVFLDKKYAYGAFSQRAHHGATMVPFENMKDLLQKLLFHLHSPVPAYFFVYWPEIDSAGHEFGPQSAKCQNAIEDFSATVTKGFLDKVDQKIASSTVVLLTADHGQISINPSETIYLDERYPQISEYFEISKQGKIMLPWGSPRDMFLRVKDTFFKEALVFLREKLHDKADIYEVDELVSKNFFGIGNIHPEFRSRTGNLLILPKKNNTVWYKHFSKNTIDMFGLHGGLSKNEMLIPFAAARLSDLC